MPPRRVPASALRSPGHDLVAERPTKAREGYPRRPTCHLGERDVERHPDRHRADRIREVVGLPEGESKPLLAVRRPDRRLDRALARSRLDGEDVAARSE